MLKIFGPVFLFLFPEVLVGPRLFIKRFCVFLFFECRQFRAQTAIFFPEPFVRFLIADLRGHRVHHLRLKLPHLYEVAQLVLKKHDRFVGFIFQPIRICLLVFFKIKCHLFRLKDFSHFRINLFLRYVNAAAERLVRKQ